MGTRIAATVSMIHVSVSVPHPGPPLRHGRTRPRHTLASIALLSLTVGWPSIPFAQAPRYPATRADARVEDHFGTRVASPYRWLGDTTSAEVQAWLGAQAELTRRYMESLGLRDSIARRIGTARPGPVIGMPKRGGGRVFYSRSAGPQSPLVVLAKADGSGRTVPVLDGAARWPDGRRRITIYRSSRDGRYLAYQAYESASGTYSFHVRDLTTGRDLPDVVDNVDQFSSVSWTLDGNGFVYDRPKPGAKAGPTSIDDDAYYHVLGRPQGEDLLLYSQHDQPDRGVAGGITGSGRYLIMNVRHTQGEGNRLYQADLGDPLNPDMHAPLQPLVTRDDAWLNWLREVRDTLYILTDQDAPNWKVIAVPLGMGPDPQPRVVVPEGPDRIWDASIVGGRLAILYLSGPTSEIRLFTLDGRPAGKVALPGVGTASTLAGEKESPELFYQFTSLVQPTTWYRYDLERGTSEPVVPPEAGVLDPDRYQTRAEFYESRDGTRVPIFVTARTGIRLDGPHPTVLAAYGAVGFVVTAANTSSVVPGAASLPAWLEMGGIFAYAAARGGGELGDAWHRAGMLDRKQNGIDDVIAAAEYLQERGYTSAEHLGVVAFSAGALVAAGAVTQRPELFAAMVLNQGLIDPLRIVGSPQESVLAQEFGSPRDSTAFSWLYAYSPLQHVRQGVCYPSVLAAASDGDWRAAQSYSLVARLQSGQQSGQPCEHPALLYREPPSGGPAANPADMASDVWAFLARETGLEKRRP